MRNTIFGNPIILTQTQLEVLDGLVGISSVEVAERTCGREEFAHCGASGIANIICGANINQLYPT
jgi:hypothetical protein